MIKIIPFNEKTEWDNIVVSFSSHDVYYSHGYVDAFKLHGDGDPILIYYESSVLRCIYVAMKRDLSLLPWTIVKIQFDKWFDLTSPYGYGGWILEGDTSIEQLHIFYNEYKKYMFEHNYVCNFVRYSPVLKNAEMMKPLSRILDLGKTIAIDLKSEETIWNNIKNRK